eukprot:7190195-Prymnesium_polylepis.3
MQGGRMRAWTCIDCIAGALDRCAGERCMAVCNNTRCACAWTWCPGACAHSTVGVVCGTVIVIKARVYH